MPAFDDRTDNIDAYLHRFERTAGARGWEEGNWAIHLSNLLRGNSLEVYSRLSTADSENYMALKAAFLKRYEMMEEGFSRRFRTSKLDKGESFSQFVVRIDKYFTRWVELGDTEKSFVAGPTVEGTDP